jgi:hypothetical protein
MDHLDGIEALFSEYRPKYFWDVAADTQKPWFSKHPRFAADYLESDWDFYVTLRRANALDHPRRLEFRQLMLSDDVDSIIKSECEYAREDGLVVLAAGTERHFSFDKNAMCCVVLLRAGCHKFLFPSDFPETGWGRILSERRDEVANVDVLLAPHHGEMDSYSANLWRIANPIVTVLGWKRHSIGLEKELTRKGYPHIRTDQTSAMIFDASGRQIELYCENGYWAKHCKFVPRFNAYHARTISRDAPRTGF